MFAIADILDDAKDAEEAIKMLKVGNISEDVAKEALSLTQYSSAITDNAEALQGLSKEEKTVGNVFKGLGSTLLSMAPAIAVSTAVGLAIYGIVKYVNAFNDAVSEAQDAQSSFSSTINEIQSLDSEIANTQSRIDELKSQGTLTIADKAELSQLQLQNAELQRQRDLKKEISDQQSKDAVDTAMDALNMNRTYDLTQESYQSQMLKSDSVIDRIAGGFMASSGATNTPYQATDITTATQNEVDALNELKQKREELLLQKDKAKGEEKENIDSQIDELNSEIEKYDTEVSKNMETLQSLRNNFINESTNELKEGLSTKEIAKYNAITKVIDDYTKKNPLAEQAEKLSDIWENDSFAQAQQKLVDAFRTGKDLSVDDIAKQFPSLVKECEKAGISVSTLREEIIALSNQDSGMTKLENDFSEFQTSAIAAINSMDSVNAALANSFSGKGLSITIDEETGAITGDIAEIKEAYSGLEGYDATTLFEKTANGVRINREALRQLQSQQEAIQKQDFLSRQKTLQEQLNKAIAEQKGLTGNDYDTQQLLINDLQTQLESVRELSSAYEGATSAYQKWLSAQSNGEEGDMFRNVSETMKERGDQLYAEGRYNTEEFRAIADYFSYEDLDAAPMEKLVEAYKNASNARDAYFTGNKQGIDNFMADMNRISQEEGFNWTKEIGNGVIEFETGADEEIAKRFNLSKEAVQALMRAATEYNDKIRVGDTADSTNYTDSLEEMKLKADEAKQKLQELKDVGNTNLNLDFNFDSTDVDNLDLQIQQATENLNQFKNESGQIDLSIEGADEAVTILQTLIQQKQVVSQPEILQIDTSQLDSAVGNIVSKLQEYQTAVNELSTLNSLQSAGIQVDTSQIDEAKAKVENIFSELKGMSQDDGSLQINADVSVNTSSIESLNSDLSAMTPEIIAKIVPDSSSLNTSNAALTSKSADVNYKLGKQESPEDKSADVNYKLGNQESPEDKSADVNYKLGNQPDGINKNATVTYSKNSLEVDTYQPSNKKAKVTFSKDSSEPDDYDPSDKTAYVNYKLGTTPSYNPSDIERTLTYNIKVNGEVPGQSSGTLYGTPSHVQGTAYNMLNLKSAYAGGRVALSKNEMAVVNELGTEGLIRNGKLYPIPGGMHMESLKKGDIILSAEQMKKLFSGQDAGHAKAYSSGTASILNAYSDGAWVFGDTGNGNLGGSGVIPSSSNNSYSSDNTQAIQENTEATEENTDEFKETVDWIERATKNMGAISDRLHDDIENFEMHVNQNAAIDNYVSHSEQYMNTLREAQNAYMSKANWLGLDGSYVHQIWAGDTDFIEDITDEDLYNKIQKYIEYYDKAKDLGDEMTELNTKIREAKISKLDNIEDDYNRLAEFAQGISDYNEAINDLYEKRNLVGSEVFVKQAIDQQAAMREALVREAFELNNQLNELVVSGDIAEYTDTWLEWKNKINDVQKSIVECDSSMEDFKETILEIRLDNFNKQLENLDFTSDMASSIRDLMSEEGIYDDNIKLTDSGIAQIGLMGTELVSAKKQVANYNIAINALKKDLQNGNITQAQYNEKLRDYQEKQMDAVKATKSARDAILDLVKDGIKKETEAMEELISKRKEDLSNQREYYKFQKEMNDQSKEMNSIRAQIAVLEGDDSLESISKVRRLQSQLQELEEKYNEDIKEHEYDVVQDAYDETLDKFKENQEDTLLTLETNLDAQNKAIADMLEVVKGNYLTVYDQLQQYASLYNITLTDSIVSPWKNATAAIQQYQEAVGKTSGNVSINTDKIQAAKPSTNQTTPTTNEAKTQNLPKSANGTWIKQDSGWWNQHADGSYVSGNWENIDGQWYKFDDQGWMQSGWQTWGKDSQGNDNWYYLGGSDDGAMKTGWFHDGNNWYLSDSSGKMLRGWQNVNGTWYYMDNSGKMLSSQWIDDKYYVDHTGAMATNGYVKSAIDDTYYWVNAKGEWEPQYNTKTPDLSRYTLFYSGGAKKAKKGLGFVDDKNQKLDLGSELVLEGNGILTDYGILRTLSGKEMIFNEEQKQALWNISNGNIPLNIQNPLSGLGNIKPVTNNNQQEINVHYDNLIGNIEYVDKNALPDLQTILKKSFDYNIKELKKYSNR